jgi:flagellar protein FliL
MAEIPTLAPAADVPLADEAAKPRKRPWFTIIIVMVLLAGAAAGGWFWATHSKGTTKEAAARVVPSGPPIYVALDPPFVTNFEAEQLVRFLQLSVQVMTRDPATAALVKDSDPVIRNDLLILFSNQKYAELSTRDGKERLRTEALAAVRKVIAANGGKPERVEAIYFTSFVMQ